MADDWARPVVHWEIRARDPQAMRAFYSAMFNWQIARRSDHADRRRASARRSSSPGTSCRSDVAGRDAVHPGARPRRVDGAGEGARRQQTTRHSSMCPDGPTIAGIADPEGNPIVLVQQ